jgi:chlorite dismutase
MPKSLAKQQAEQLDRQLAHWEATAEQNKREQAEFARLRAQGKLPSIVDRFDVSAYQQSIINFNKKTRCSA